MTCTRMTTLPFLLLESSPFVMSDSSDYVPHGLWGGGGGGGGGGR